jgi:hypothetical protein
MKKKILLTLLPAVLAFAANAETFLVDFNTADSGTYPGSSAWNSYALPGDINTGGALSNSSGLDTTGITLSYTGTMRDSTNSGTNALINPANAPSWVGSSTATAASSDYFFTDNGEATTPASFTLQFSGFNEGDQVSLDLWASRNAVNAEGNYEYSYNGTDWFGFNVLKQDGSAETDTLIADGWDTNTTQSQTFNNQTDGSALGRYMNVGGLAITDTESLYVKVTDPIGANVGVYAVLGAVQLVVIPEPSTSAALFGMLALGLTLIRRNRQS